jgi:glycosyltransferase involved in cell wall biosynthesis
MTVSQPLITVVMATWGRGRHILPSVQSALRQSFGDFELLIVGDACTDETAQVVLALKDPRIRWLNLEDRVGSQSGPNTAGIAAARGAIIAYLGHDDIWEPMHLERLAAVFQAENSPDFAVSGLINHHPNGLDGSQIMGLFIEDSAKHRHYFPPSCVAHRRSVIDRIGGWNAPKDIRAPVATDLFKRAADADLRFASTGVITVHKFAAGLRYLSYLCPGADEQARMLADLDAPDHADRMARIVKTSRRLGRYMVERPRDFGNLEIGQSGRQSDERRGLRIPKLRPLGRGVTLVQKRHLCAMDWRETPIFGIRLHTRNPWPRILLPVIAAHPAIVTIRVIHPDRQAFEPLQLLCNGQFVTALPKRVRPSLWGWSALYVAKITLLTGAPSVLELRLSPAQLGKMQVLGTELGFGIGRIGLRPARERG